jgi:deoxyribodipyrimidine photo-lyase
MPTEPTSTTGRADDLSAAAGLRLPPPRPGRRAAEEYVVDHLGSLLERRGRTGPLSSPVIRGGQMAADAALAAFTVDGYRARRRDAYPQNRRRASGLSPYVRHGLLSLHRLWSQVVNGPPDDVAAFRHALLRQEYARHWYARLGDQTRRLMSRAPEPTPPQGHVPAAGAQPAPVPVDLSAAPVAPLPVSDPDPAPPGLGGGAGRVLDGSESVTGWDRRMGCVEIALDELEEDGWLVEETRRWLAVHWVGAGQSPAHGDAQLHRHLLDGSRAAGRLGWLLATGAAGQPAVPASRWDVERHAPGLCATCELVHCCPIEDTANRIDRELGLTTATTVSPPDPASAPIERTGADAEGRGRLPDHPLLAADPDPARTAGPSAAVITGRPEAVWLTAESLGDADPALVAHPDLPALFVFDQPLLRRLRLSAKRLVFLVETLADLASRRPVEVALGDPVAVLAGRSLAATYTPVPGWRRRSARLDVVAIHPWAWLQRPHQGSVSTYPEWLAGVELQWDRDGY